MKQVWISTYDYQSAQICAESNVVDSILVGDSLAMVLYGLESTCEATMEMMLRHTEAVKKGAGDIPVIADMPYKTYQTAELALLNAKKFREAHVSHVKLEGGKEVAPQIEMLLKNNFQVTGHLGLLPQTAKNFSLAGNTPETAEKIFQDSIFLEKLGISSLVLECIPESLGKKITEKLKIPVIGIGAGKYADGQILVLSDLVGRTAFQKKPKFLRTFGNIRKQEISSIQKFSASVRSGEYPNQNEGYVSYC